MIRDSAKAESSIDLPLEKEDDLPSSDNMPPIDPVQETIATKNDSLFIYQNHKIDSKSIAPNVSPFHDEALEKFEKDMMAVDGELQQPEKYFKKLLRKILKRKLFKYTAPSTLEFYKSFETPAFYKQYVRAREAKYLKETGR